VKQNETEVRHAGGIAAAGRCFKFSYSGGFAETVTAVVTSV